VRSAESKASIVRELSTPMLSLRDQIVTEVARIED